MKRGWIAVACLLLFLPLVKSAAGEEKQKVSFSAKEPVLLTSAGQSADIQMVKVIMDRLKISQKFAALAGPGDLQGMGSLVVVIGGSTKGLGAAGLDVDKELERIRQLLGKARENKSLLIAMHIGGKGRRGELSDKFIQLVAPAASYLVVVNEGDADGIFTNIASKHKIPMIGVTRIFDLQEHLKNIYQKQGGKP